MQSSSMEILPTVHHGRGMFERHHYVYITCHFSFNATVNMQNIGLLKCKTFQKQSPVLTCSTSAAVTGVFVFKNTEGQ